MPGCSQISVSLIHNSVFSIQGVLIIFDQLYNVIDKNNDEQRAKRQSVTHGLESRHGLNQDCLNMESRFSAVFSDSSTQVANQPP